MQVDNTSDVPHDGSKFRPFQQVGRVDGGNERAFQSRQVAHVICNEKLSREVEERGRSLGCAYCDDLPGPWGVWVGRGRGRGTLRGRLVAR